MFHRETDAAKVARNRDAVFDLHAAALDWLEKYTAIPYPFGKFDFLLVPRVPVRRDGAPGGDLLQRQRLLLDESATQDQMLGRASAIAHETAHMWFGDLVTMQWFNDVWMKEVFANFMAAKIVNPAFPDVNHDLRYLVDYYPPAYGVDRTAGTNEIRQPLENLNEAGTLRRHHLSEGAHRDAPARDAGRLRCVPGRPARLPEGACLWQCLVAGSDQVLDGRTPEDLAAWSRAWVEERGRPAIRTELTLSGGKIRRLAFTQRDPYPSRGLLWNQRITVAVGGRDVKLVPVQLNAARVEVPAARGLPAQFVLPNGGGIAYGEFHLDAASLAWLTANLPSIDDELTRGSAWVTLYDAMLDAEVTPDAFLSLALRALPLEKNELNVSRILSYRPGGLLAVFLAPGPRAPRAARGAGPAAGPGRGALGEPEIGVVLGAARHRADHGDPRVADARVEAGREGPRPDAVGDRLHPPGAGARRPGRGGRIRPSSISSTSGRRTPIGRRSSRSSGRRSRRMSANATRGSRRWPTWPTAATSRGCSKACATSTIRCAPRRRRNTSSRA